MTSRTNPDDLLADLLSSLAAKGAMQGADRIEAAYRVACQAHAGQLREDGAPYVTHPVAVARILVEQWEQQDPEVLAAALLHDAVEDSPLTLAEVEAGFGARTAGLVDLLTKAPLPGVGDREPEKAARDAAYFARLKEGPAEAALIKAADRVHNLSEVLHARWPEAKKRFYAREALDALLPLARAHGLERAATALEEAARDLLTRLDRGEGDVPDVGPHDEVEGAGQLPEDPTFVASRHLSFFRRGPDVFLYHDLVGDIMQLHEKVLPFVDYFAEPRLESEAREAFKDEFEEGDLDAFFETFLQHLVLVPEGHSDERVVANWHPTRGPWLISYREEDGRVTLCYKDRRSGDLVLDALPPLLGALFEHCDGQRTTSEVCARLEKQFPGEPDVAARTRQTIRAWTHSQRQLLKMLPRPRSAYEMIGLPPYAQSTMPYPLLRPSGTAAAEPEGTRDYHKVEIASADEQFDLKETTISHALRVPHPALSGRTYGGALANRLIERDVLPDRPRDAGRPFRLVEVGGGTGYFARAFLDGIALRAPRLYNSLRYTVVELSPELRRSQTERTKPHADRLTIVAGDAERLPLDDQSVDFLVANEMIADLRVAPVRREDVDGPAACDGDGGPGAEAVRRWSLPVQDAPGLFFVNLGALKLLEEVARVLRPGGTALLTEYGHQSRYPEQSTHLDHAEFSIHFGHMKEAAERMGLETTLEQLGSLIGLEPKVEVLQTTQTYFETLRAFFARRGVKLGKVAYTRDMLAELVGDKLDPDRLEGLQFGPCGNRLLGLKPPEFQALVIRRPRTAGREVSKVTLDL